MNGRNVPVLGVAMVAFAAVQARNAVVGLAFDAQVLAHRARRFRPVCAVLGHHYPDLTVCTRCTTPFDRVRDGARPR